MIFNQFSFLLIFLPAVLAAFYCPGAQRLRVGVLLLASFVFYGLSGLEHAAVLIFGIAWVYAATRSPAIRGSRARLVIAVVPPLGALVFYKYLGFLLAPFGGQGARENFSLFSEILLPAGISFFTFQLMAYAIDRYRGEVAEPPGFARFALYVSFFPQLVAGPIVRLHEVIDRLVRLADQRLTTAEASRAIAYICAGLAAKVLLADTLDAHQAAYVADPGGLSPIAAGYVVLAYSFQIYFDFFGYSLIAIGLGLLFGFHLPRNFARPYEAPNPREFWRRWHITLSFWIRDYLYVPLGGNSHYVRNILIVFAVCGLWHGAGWTFIAWGLFHGVLVVAYHGCRGAWDRLPRLVQQAGTFTLVSLGWLLFVFDFAGFGAFMASLAGQSAVSQADPNADMWLMLAVSALACFAFPFERWTEAVAGGRWSSAGRTVAAAFMLVAAMLFLDRSGTFIYFRF